jgi:putative transposase
VFPPDLVGGGLIRSIGGWSALRDLRETNTRVISDERILGSSEFAESVLRDANEAYERKTEIMAKGLSIDQLIITVAKYMDLDADLIAKRGKKRSVALARSIICALAVDRLMLSGADIARRLHITPSAVSKLVARGRGETMLPEMGEKIFEK